MNLHHLRAIKILGCGGPCHDNLLLLRGLFSLKASGVALPKGVRHYKCLLALDARNLGPVHCNGAICIVELYIQIALIELYDLTGNAVAIFELNNVFLLSRGTHYT